MINQTQLIGRLGKDPEIKTGENYTLATFSLATSESYKDKSGEWQEQTEWHNVKAWGYNAQRCEKLNTGDLVWVTGKIHYDSYEVEGVKKYRTEIIASQIRALKVSGEGQTAQEPAALPAGDDDGSDMPF